MSAAPRVILDTNVLVAAGFRPGSTSSRIVESVRSGEVELVWDEPTWRESHAVVSRIPHLDWDRFDELYRPEGRYEAPTPIDAFEHVPDPTDRKFAALALVTGATLLSSDQDLLADRDFSSARILTPREWWAEYTGN